MQLTSGCCRRGKDDGECRTKPFEPTGMTLDEYREHSAPAAQR